MSFEKIKVYAFVGPSGTGKSYRAQMVASEKDIHFIIDDGLLINDNEIIAGVSAKKAPTKIETVKHALFYEDDEKKPIEKAIKKYKRIAVLTIALIICLNIIICDTSFFFILAQVHICFWPQHQVLQHSSLLNFRFLFLLLF